MELAKYRETATKPRHTQTNLPIAVKVDIQMAGGPASQPVEFIVPMDAVARTNVILGAGPGI